MRIMVIGAGMYVTGRGGLANATILSSLAEISKSIPIEKVVVIAKNKSNDKLVVDKVKEINLMLGTSLKVKYERVGKNIPQTISSLNNKYEFNCAIVAVPDDLHFPYLKSLLENKIHSLIVKPLTPTVAEAKKLIKIQNEKNVWGAVEFHKRLDESNLYIKKIYQQNILGKLQYITVHYSQRITIPKKAFRKWSSRTNIFQYLGVHYVDLIYFLTGYYPAKLMAIGTYGVLKDEGIDTFDSIHAIIAWKDPKKRNDTFISTFNTNWIDPVSSSALSDQKYEIIGSKSRVKVDQKNRGIELVHNNDGLQHINPYFSEYLEDPSGKFSFTGYGFESVKQFITDVMDLGKETVTIELLKANRPSFDSSLISVAVCEAVSKSLQNDSKWIKLVQSW